MPLILGANSLAGGYQIKNSARFNSGSSDYLNRTPSSAGNRKTWTWSGWVKLLGTNMYLFGASSDSWASNYSTVWINSGAQLRLELGGISGDIVSANLFRDPSAWYHFVVAVDTTQATANNRVRMYVNGVETAYTTQTMPAQNSDTMINSAQYHQISGRPSTQYLNGYLAEINLIDGQQLTPSSFGETDEDTGIWKPKAYTGSFGTNGFYLDFEDSANLGNDMSGNNNDFTVNNLTSIDQTTDTPTNNFATLNPLDKQSGTASAVISEGNTVIDYGTSSSVSGTIWGTIGVNTGKWYAEFNLSTYAGSSTLRCGFVKFSSTSGATKDVSATGIFMVALDLTNSLYWVGTNGVWDAGDPSAGTGGTSLTPSDDFYTITVRDNSGTAGNGGTWKINTGNPAFTIVSGNADANGYGNFEYAVPSGYYALCTKNLAQYG